MFSRKLRQCSSSFPRATLQVAIREQKHCQVCTKNFEEHLYEHFKVCIHISKSNFFGPERDSDHPHENGKTRNFTEGVTVTFL